MMRQILKRLMKLIKFQNEVDEDDEDKNEDDDIKDDILVGNA